MKVKKIFVAGHKGMVGSALTRILKSKKNNIVITADKTKLNLLKQSDVERFFKNNIIDQVYLAAARVGGIYANNTYPAKFIYENLMIQCNVIHSAYLSKIKKLLFLGSSCVYPKKNKGPIKENHLLSGKLEPTNEPYAIAKISGIKMCESYNRQFGQKYGLDYRSIMPTNLFGPGDNYHPENSHVVPALIHRFHNAKINSLPSVIIWGSGKPKREFLYVDDLARASIHIMNLKKKIYNDLTTSMCSHINIGSGEDISILELVKIIKKIVGYKGKVKFDRSKPDGTYRKLLSSKILKKTGFKIKSNFKNDLEKTYKAFLNI